MSHNLESAGGISSVDVMIESQRAMTAVLEQMADSQKSIVGHQTQFHNEIGAIRACLTDLQTGMHSVDKRLAVIEVGTLERDVSKLAEEVDKLEVRVLVLEQDKQLRDGAFKSVNWLGANWAWIVGIIALIAALTLKIEIPK